MPSLDLSIVTPYSELLATGLWWTVVLFLSSSALSLLAGIAFALIVLYTPRLVSLPIRFMTWLLMGTRCCYSCTSSTTAWCKWGSISRH